MTSHMRNLKAVVFVLLILLAFSVKLIGPLPTSNDSFFGVCKVTWKNIHLILYVQESTRECWDSHCSFPQALNKLFSCNNSLSDCVYYIVTEYIQCSHSFSLLLREGKIFASCPHRGIWSYYDIKYIAMYTCDIPWLTDNNNSWAHNVYIHKLNQVPSLYNNNTGKDQFTTLYQMKDDTSGTVW